MRKQWLHELVESPGGKIHGLAELNKLSIPVPLTLVILDVDVALLDRLDLSKELKKFPGAMIVRSSVSVEDGDEASYAGFFPSFPGVHTEEEVKEAIRKIANAANEKMQLTYSRENDSGSEWTVSVILQPHIEPLAAGVLFSADPVTQRRDKIIIQPEAGSSVVAEHHYKRLEYYKQLTVPEPSSCSLFTHAHVTQLCSCAMLSEEKAGRPVDMEWVIDQQGKLFFVQMRPITTLTPIHWNELDDEDHGNYSLYTLSAISEMVPGAITPLTNSLFGDAIDYGAIDFARRSGIPERLLRKRRYVKFFYYHLFLNMTALYDFPKYISYSKRANLEIYTMGRRTGEPELPKTVGWARAHLNLLKQLRYFVAYSFAVTRLEVAMKEYIIPAQSGIDQLYEVISHRRDIFIKSFRHYFRVTSFTSTMHYISCLILSRGKDPDADVHSRASALLQYTGNIVSSEPVNELENIAAHIRRHEHFRNGFAAATDEDAWIMLSRFAPEDIGRQFQRFIGRHGHRSTKEAELMESPWKEDNDALVRLLKYILSKPEKEQLDKKQVRKKRKEIMRSQPSGSLLFLRIVLRWTKKGFIRREQAKSHIIKMASRTRDAYRTLATRMVSTGLLDNTELIFFLHHDEIGKLLREKDAEYWNDVAAQRKKVFGELSQLEFEELYRGKPVPVERPEEPEQAGIFTLRGLIGSPGLVKGKVRMITTMEEAESIQAGEILVTLVSDTGLTPYFNRIAGIITEIGHPLSHGAIIAREFGIPALLGVKNITRILQNGDEIILDAEKGLIERLS